MSNDFTINIINKRTYDLKNAKKFWTKKLYNELIEKDNDTLEREKSNRFENYNILNILNNVCPIFTSVCLHYKNVPKETMLKEDCRENKIKKRKIG